MARLAVYPGSFDPIHLGHVDVIERAAKLFDTLIVAVFVNVGKTPRFSAEERMQLVQAATQHIPNVRVEKSEDLLVRYAQERQVEAIVRGLRAVLDFDYEFQIALMNKKMAPDLETIFILTSEKYSYLSSTLVKELASYHADVKGLVPPVVALALQEKFAGSRG
ncbi:MAG: pantetheine-phosphate adenylyltransferase [Sulfobacillus thermosulfidooxidans]|uniref:Phosphopantetheine adenylyltransferase n=1 Tax=Sulfobacillus thermotolerans TaxID=338644 RepID=A0ABN5H1G4_9FIRM|nr:pantetheine-phosphate adenylyltransferase [Sulfobacillus sp. hq2]AUW94515.1 pantetheine-phosphate adenylyltransferase [Sulfobacillus thermotolerans]MCY0908047.1 pantetheine-phosphate adenylyltransferase [Sulfobacillus thermotolerans]POB09191.1 pantetheine-phosphate adenylyltransferase [Sulfobacillus sp. hq2]PSR36913.1 MAG: pantetheine-phosphate adenylyltransferase [Sulfobacillus thermosulfidooxidans]